MKRLGTWTLLITLGLGTVARAQDDGLISQPDWWASQWLPETGDKLEIPAWMTGVEKARAEAWAGRYHQALFTLHTVKDADPIQAAIVQGRCWAGLAQRSQAITVLSNPKVASDPQVQTLKAQILIDDGRFKEAIALLQQHLATHEMSICGRYLLGKAYESSGDIENAIASYKWFIEKPHDLLDKWSTKGEEAFENAEEVTCLGRAVDGWATLTGAYRTDRNLHGTILRIFTRVFDVMDRNYWPAHIAAAEFQLARSNVRAARVHLQMALEANPNDPKTMLLLAQVAVGMNDMAGATVAMDTLRRADPDSMEAEIIEIYTQVRSDSIESAADRAERLVKRFPDRLEALGAASGLAQITADDPKSAQYLARADTLAPRSPLAYTIAGELLGMRHQQVASEKMFETALARSPWDTSIAHGLGELYLNNGREDEARKILTNAYEVDPFNLKTVNYLRLLDELAKFNRIETAHYVFYFDQGTDPLVQQFMAPYMEQAYDEVTSFFQYQPPVKIRIQVYPSEDEFSVRMAGIPGIENYGVSFGHVLAVIAPREGTTKGNFHWARVMKHEFTHTINLLQTDSRIPRWLTEGLAVWQEGLWLRFPDVPRELAVRAEDDKLFSVRGLALAFLRPKTAGDGEQAYTQSSWLGRYMETKYGHDAVLKLINAYGHGKIDEEAFEIATGTKLDQFEKEFHAWVKEETSHWGYRKDAKEEKKINDDLAKLAKDGESMIKAKQFKEAIDIWEKYRTIRPLEKIPHQRLAYLYLQKDTHDSYKAIANLEFLHWLELSNTIYARQIAREYSKLGEPDKALWWAKQLVYMNLYDPQSHEMLADIAEKAGQTEIADRSKEAIQTIRDWKDNFDKNTQRRAEEKAKSEGASTPE